MKKRPKEKRPGHPLAHKNGTVPVHRRVLFDALGGHGAPCHWCSTPLRWKSTRADELCVDHLDGDTENNDRRNLVPSCRGCNANREDGTGYGRREDKPCARCGVPVPRDQHHKRRKYCSTACSSPSNAKRETSASHGTRSRYVYGCRCGECRSANSAYSRELYSRNGPPALPAGPTDPPRLA